jgi:hypothetical protein
MKWGGHGVGTERSEGWIQKDMEGSGISSPLCSLSSVRMNADSECARSACVCLKLGVWLGCIFCVVRHTAANGMKRRSAHSVTAVCVLQPAVLSEPSKEICVILLDT